MKYKSSILLSIFFLLFILFTAASIGATTTFITIGTGGLTGVYYPTGSTIAKTVNQKRKELGIRCTVESTDGSVYNVNAVVAGDLDFGIVQSDRQFQAVEGIGEWRDKGPQEKLRSVFNIYPESFNLLVAVDADIKSIEDLKGKRVNLGNIGSGHLGNSLDVLKFSGLDPAVDIQAKYSNPIEAPGLLQDGKIDAFFFTDGHPSNIIKEASAGGRKVKLIQISTSGISELVNSLPRYSMMSIPIKYYQGVQNTHDILTFGVCATLVTSSNVPDEIVYAVTKAMFENLETFKKLHPAYSTITKKSMLEGLSVPIHPGAMKYYKEAGLK